MVLEMRSSVSYLNDNELSVLHWYSLNAICEKSGNVWIRNKNNNLIDGNGLIVTASDDKYDYISGLYGRLERRSAYCLSKLLERTVKCPRINELDSGLGDSQRAAILRTLSSPISLICGGPGTGKTTIAKTIGSYHKKVIGLSPTGKGADRLSESICCPCYTIDRAIFLYRSRDNDQHTDRDSIDFLHYDLVIIDESGMCDTQKLEMLLAALLNSKTVARIVFIGDSGQLPSVGPGRVIDELKSCIPFSQLDVVYRFDDADIGRACLEAKSGRLHSAHSDNYRILESLSDSYGRCILEYSNLCNEFSVYETRLLTIHRDDAFAFNHSCLRRFPFKPPVVCLRNSYKHQVFNGQTGYSTANFLYFGRDEIPKRSISWSYSFASTCHKAQGGQWSAIVIWIPSARYLSREWLNTAISRATRKVVIVCRDLSVTESCLKASKLASSRISLLSAFVKGTATWDS